MHRAALGKFDANSFECIINSVSIEQIVASWRPETIHALDSLEMPNLEADVLRLQETCVNNGSPNVWMT